MCLYLSRGVGELPVCLYSERSCPSGALTGYRPHGYFSGVLPRAASAGSGAPPLIQNLGKLAEFAQVGSVAYGPVGGRKGQPQGACDIPLFVWPK